MLRIVAVGRLKDARWAGLADDYLRRIRPWAPVEVVEVRDSDPAREGRDLLAAARRRGGTAPLIALDERGEQLTTRELAALLAQHRSLTFVVGGPDGLSDAVRDAANRQLSLSRLTLPHEMARVLLLEQIYRGLSLHRGGRYHRD